MDATGAVPRAVPRTLCLLLAAVLGWASPARAQTPTITFQPAGRTFYGANQQVQVHLCDDYSIRDVSTRVWLNGTQLTTPSWTQGDASCAVHHVLAVNVTLASGTNTLQVKACETIAPESCLTESDSYIYTTPDAVKPVAQIVTAGTTVSSSTLPVTVGWCDDYKLNLASVQMFLNDNAVSIGNGTPNTSPYSSCYASATSSATLTLQPGANVLKAVVRDSAGNVSDTARATYTYVPTISVVGEGRVRRPGLCAVACFDATLGFSTAPYTSLDAPRAASLVYSSAHAAPRAMVQVDVAVGTGPVPSTIGLTVMNGGGAKVALFNRQQLSAYYAGTSGTNRVAAWFDASSLPTGTYLYAAEVSRQYSTGTVKDTVPVRFIVINETGSPYGAGWSLAGEARVVVPTGTMDPSGVTVVSGDGTAVFFALPSSCGSSVPCTYVSPPSEFSTLARTSTGYVLKGVEGDSTLFTLTGRMTASVDRFGNQTSYAYYDSACSWCMVGRLGTITDPAGKQIYLAYVGSRGVFQGFNIMNVTSASVAIDTNGDLTAISDLDNVFALTATYSNHRLTGYTDRAANQTDLQYDSAGKVASIIGPAYRAQGSSGWRDTTRITSYDRAVLPAPGVAAADPASAAAAVSPASAYAWVVGSRSDSTRLHLDAWKAADQVRDPRGYVTSTIRNADGLVTSMQDAVGNTTSLAWNGRLLAQATDPNGTVAYEYDTSGRVTRESGSTAETKYFYSAGAAWVVDSVHVEGGGTTRFTYDSRGRVLTQRDSASHTSTIVYETTGWLNTKQVIEPGSRTTTYAGWDNFGRATQVTAPDNTVSQVTYDVLGRVTTATAPDLGVARYYYGVAQLDSIKDARNQVFKWTRNELGWVESETRPDDGSAHRSAIYDRYGRVVSSTDRRGQSVAYTYDTRDRVTMMVAGTDTTQWSYSPDQPGVATAPAWTFVRNALSSDSLHYDVQGRLARAVTSRNMQGVPMRYEVAYAYNTLGGVDTLKYRVNGGTWEWARFAQNLSTGMLTSVRDFSGRTTSLSYNGEGALRTITYPNTQVATLSYTSTHQLSQIGYSAINLSAAAGVGYTYDSFERISRRSTNRNAAFRDFTYDSDGRLASHTDYVRSASHPSCQLIEDQGWVCNTDSQFTQTGQRSYTYDLTDNPTDRGALIGLNNRLNGYDGWTITYDLEGNMTGRSKTGQPTYGYTWDALGRLASVQVNGTTVAAYGYDGLGRRVQRNGSGGYKYYVFAGGNPLLDVGNGVQTLEEYLYLPGSDAPFAMRHGGIPFWFHNDPQGSVLGVTDQYGNVSNQYSYTPYGVAETVAEGFANRIRYAGREWDADAGLYYNRARWYDPQMQRFISQDPIGIEGGLNMYAYAGDDPVNGSDPSGLMTCVRRTDPVGHFIVHKGDPMIFDTYWECDYWGMPISEFGDLRTLFGSQCTALGLCLGPCMKVGTGCQTRDPDEAEWAMIGTRIRQVVNSDPVCQGTRDILENWYKGGPSSGHFLIWNGDWLQPLPDGRPGINRGVPLADGMALSHDYLVGNPSHRPRPIVPDRYLVVHEALHVYANTNLVPSQGLVRGRGGFGDFEENGGFGPNSWVRQMQQKCTSR